MCIKTTIKNDDYIRYDSKTMQFWKFISFTDSVFLLTKSKRKTFKSKLKSKIVKHEIISGIMPNQHDRDQAAEWVPGDEVNREEKDGDKEDDVIDSDDYDDEEATKSDDNAVSLCMYVLECVCVCVCVCVLYSSILTIHFSLKNSN